MSSSPSREPLAHQFFLSLVKASQPLQAGADDREVALQALIRAAELLRERLEEELAELRREEAD